MVESVQGGGYRAVACRLRCQCGPAVLLPVSQRRRDRLADYADDAIRRGLPGTVPARSTRQPRHDRVVDERAARGTVHAAFRADQSARCVDRQDAPVRAPQSAARGRYLQCVEQSRRLRRAIVELRHLRLHGAVERRAAASLPARSAGGLVTGKRFAQLGGV